MVDLRRERDLRRLERIIRRECYGQEENATGVWRVALPRVNDANLQ